MPVSTAVRKPGKSPRPRRAEAAPPRLRLLAGGLALLLAAAAFVWWEPAELWLLSRGTAAGLERYARAHPDSRPAALALAGAYLREGKAPAAAALLQPLVERYPEDPDLRFMVGRSLMEAGSEGDSYAHFQVVLTTLRPGDPETRWWLGQLLERTGKTAEAYDQYEALVAAQPKHAPALIRLSVIAMGDGRTTKAEELLRRAVAAAPENAEAHARLAEVLFRLGKAEEAIPFGRRSVQLNPKEVRGSFWLGRSLSTVDPQGGAAEAEAAYRRVIESSQEGYTARYFLAKLYRELGRTEDAARELEASTRENPLHKNGFYDLALCRRALGQPREAEQAMARFRKLNDIDQEGTALEYRVWSQPGDVPAMLALVRHYLANRRPDLARPFVERILREAPRHQEALRMRAQIAAHPEPSL